MSSKNVEQQCILRCDGLGKDYTQGTTTFTVLDDINFQLYANETVSIMGSSGSGKSTLLHLLAGLDRLTRGTVSINGFSISTLKDDAVCKLRNKHIGFIYQFHHLLPEFTAYENIMMPLIIGGNTPKEHQEYAYYLLETIGLTDRANHFPGQLSGGERQRVAILRALINKPQVVFADEPTGNLDNSTAHHVLDIFFELQAVTRTSLVVVTHDSQIASRTSVQYKLTAGGLAVNC